MGTNITGIDTPVKGDTNYKNKINNSLNAMDDHDHGAGKGLAVKRLGTNAADDSTTTVASNKLDLKDDGIQGIHLHADAADGVSVEIASNKLQVKDAGVDVDMWAVKTVTTNGTDPGAGGLVRSNPTASYTNATSSYTYVQDGGGDVDAVLTTSGRPVIVMLDADLTTNTSLVQLESASGAEAEAFIVITRTPNGGAEVDAQSFHLAYDFTSTPNVLVSFPTSSFSFLDTAVNGSADEYTYKVKAKSNGSTTIRINDIRLVAVEI